MKTSNKNVPRDAKVILEKVFMSGEIIETIYEKDGKLYLVGDWSWAKPEEVSKEYVEKYLGRKLDND